MQETEIFKVSRLDRQTQYQQRIEDFVNILPNIQITELTERIDLSHDHPADKAAQSFITNNHAQQEPVLYIAPEATGILGGGFTGFHPLVASGSKASRNGVFFGAFALNDGTEMRVAVKPHVGVSDDTLSRREAEEACLRDYFVNIAARDAKLDTLIPVGFLMNRDGTQYSLSLLDEDLLTMDSTDWTKYFSTDIDNEGMKEQWRKAAAATALVHSTGQSNHGDLAPRNIATDVHGHVFLIDWEYGNISNKPVNDIEERFGNSWKDLKSLMASMVRPTTLKDNPGIGILKGFEGVWWEAFQQIFMDEYASWRIEFANQGSHRGEAVKQVREEIEQLEYALRSQMEDWQAMYSRRHAPILAMADVSV